MQQHNLFRDYLDKVCEQIRWKKAHSVVCRELGDHLKDEQAAQIDAGITEDEAANQAVLDMGDATLVGSQLDRAYRPRPAWSVIAVTAALMIIGFFARIYIVDHIEIHYIQGNNIPRSMLWLCITIVALVVGYFLDYTILGKHPLLIGAGFAIVLMLLPYVYDFMTYRLYYSNYFMIFIPIVYVAILWWWPYQGYSGLIGSYLSLLVLVIAGLVLRGSIAVFVYGGICGLMLTAELLKGRFAVKKPRGMLILYSPIVLFFLWLWNNSSIGEQVKIILHPELEPLGRGFQASQIRLVLESARWIGQGGHTASNVPDLINSNMLTFFIHQFGWISLAIVLLLFGALIVFSSILTIKQKSRLGRMVSMAILISLTVEGSVKTSSTCLPP